MNKQIIASCFLATAMNLAAQTSHSITDFSFVGDSTVPRPSATYNGDPNNTLQITSNRVDTIDIGGTDYSFPSYFTLLGSNGYSINAQPRPVGAAAYNITLTFANPVNNLKLDIAGFNARLNGATLEYEQLTTSIIPSSVTTLSGDPVIWDGAYQIQSQDDFFPHNSVQLSFASAISTITFKYEYVGDDGAPSQIDGIAIDSISYTNTVPEPSNSFLLGMGILILTNYRKRKL